MTVSAIGAEGKLHIRTRQEETVSGNPVTHKARAVGGGRALSAFKVERRSDSKSSLGRKKCAP